jgi:uncharacterized protein YbaP (TraB family)
MMKWSNQALTIAAAASLASAAQAQPSPPPSRQQVDEIVVTARRTGIPVWKVSGPLTSIVLIGDFEGVAKGTKWNPEALEETLRKADRVMYPSAVNVEADMSPLAAIGLLLKYRKRSTLPKGQTLVQFMRPEEYRRLVELQQRGILEPGFERKHPFHLVVKLRKHARQETEAALSAASYVRKAVKTLRIPTIPIQTVDAGTAAKAFLDTPPARYVPCLLDTAALVAAGAEGARAGSEAWAARRVPDAIESLTSRAHESCAPESVGIRVRADLRTQVRQLLSDPMITVAVVGIRSLARPSGILDHLAAQGFAIQGPRWR